MAEATIIEGNKCCDEEDLRPQFGNRHLTNPNDIFLHNAWDNVNWGPEQETIAKQKVCENSAERADPLHQQKLESEADQMWDSFYGIHRNRFFKDRQWIFTEFPEVAPRYKHTHVSTKATTAMNNLQQQSSRSDLKILEVGCGVGNTVVPILKTNDDPNLRVYACDFSSTAVELLKESPDFDKNRCFPFVCDVTRNEWNAPFQPDTLDIVILIFVLSAIQPDKMSTVASKLFDYLRPGGVVLFRDYGRYDLAQLRFKKGKCLADNFYARGDGTRVYFFTQEDLTQIFQNAGFIEEQNIVDRKLQVNRGKQLTMYRVWVQAKFRKPLVN